MGAAGSRTQVAGVVTGCKSSDEGIVCRRVCVSAKGEKVCAIGKRKGKRDACQDACACACDKVLGWWRGGECRRDCVAACDQPGRVVKSEFSGVM